MTKAARRGVIKVLIFSGIKTHKHRSNVIKAVVQLRILVEQTRGIPAKYRPGEDGFKVTKEMKEDFQQYGYIIVRKLLDDEEIGRVKQSLESENSIWENSFAIINADGRQSRLCIWSNPGDDVTGMVARSEKIAGTSEELLGGEVYHYHSKLMMKEAKTGGKFVWHQDYGYWYQNGNLFPDMLTAFIAVDPCTKENGCLQILPGSNRCGRIEHTTIEGQQGADIERVEEIKKKLPPVDVLLEPGDVLFFHCNVLHASGPNTSSERRWALLVAYNCKSNNPVIEHQHPQYRPLIKVKDTAIKTASLTMKNMKEKEFMDPHHSRTLTQIVTNK